MAPLSRVISNRFTGSGLGRAVVAALATGVALLITLAQMNVARDPMLVIFAGAVVVSALLAGFEAGWMATVFSLLSVAFLVEPLKSANELIRLVLFGGIALSLAWAVGRTSQMRRRLAEDVREKTQLLARISQLASIVESSQMAIYSKRLDGTIISWNRAAEEMYGYTAQEAIGRNITMLIPKEYAAEEQGIVATVASGKMTPRYDTERLRKDGTRIYIAQVVSPVRDEYGLVVGASGMSRDITPEKQREEALRHSETELRTLSEAIPHMVWKANAGGQAEYFNRRWYQYTGTSEEEALGWGWEPAVHPDDLHEVRQRWRTSLETGATFEGEYRLRRADGAYRWYLGRAVPMRNAAGQVVEWFGTCTDIHEYKQAQAMLATTERAAAMGRMAGSIAHEINNPLAAITNLVVLLSHKKMDDFQAKSYLNMLSHEVARVVHITRQTLGFYQESRTPVPIDLRLAVEDVVSLYAKEIAGKEIKLEKSYGAVTEIEAFPAEIRHMISSVVMNAIEAVGRNGRIRIAIDETPLDPGKLTVTVTDNGPGIAAEIAERVFEPFFSTKGEKGTGLGLWVSRGIAQRHGGELRFLSTTQGPERGTTFTIVLPVKAPGEGARRGAA